jgi:hypothetical protein
MQALFDSVKIVEALQRRSGFGPGDSSASTLQPFNAVAALHTQANLPNFFGAYTPN